MFNLSRKVALVTGASRGIGRAIAITLGSKGARVVINFTNNEDQAHETAKQVAAAGGPEPVVSRFDVASAEQVDEAVDNLSKSLGGIDILVNNAGISKDGLLMRYRDEDWQRVLSTNLTGSFYCAKACSRSMIKKRFGRIIQISSVVGETGNAGQVAYASAKAGMIGMTKTLARELASRNITVNAVTPGFIETDMTSSIDEKSRLELVSGIPLGFIGAPQDIANAVLFLSSEEARYVTGHVLAVNGGMYM
jgi:3-oxoacyl-[acyl-carrier protein] reductase